MIARCYNKSHDRYKQYGAVGIKVCKRWMKFENFLADMGEPPEKTVLDRKNNNAGYSLENCRWATFKKSTENRKNTVWLANERVGDMALRLNIPASRIYGRLRFGWSKERIESNPKPIYNGLK